MRRLCTESSRSYTPQGGTKKSPGRSVYHAAGSLGVKSEGKRVSPGNRELFLHLGYRQPGEDRGIHEFLDCPSFPDSVHSTCTLPVGVVPHTLMKRVSLGYLRRLYNLSSAIRASKSWSRKSFTNSRFDLANSFKSVSYCLRVGRPSAWISRFQAT